MKKLIIAIFVFALIVNSSAQTFTYHSTDTIRNYQLAAVETFYVPVVNISSVPIKVFAVRKLINVPPNWVTSICFDGTCFADYVDSVANTSDFGFTPLAPGDTILLGLHFFTDSSNSSGSAMMIVGNLDNPSETRSLTFYLTNDPLSVDEKNILIGNFRLFQNYPNPFNPSTVISFELFVDGYITLKVFDVLGSEIATLIINDFKNAGKHEIKFNINNEQRTMNDELTTSIYFYRLTVDNFSSTKKFVLIK